MRILHLDLLGQLLWGQSLCILSCPRARGLAPDSYTWKEKSEIMLQGGSAAAREPVDRRVPRNPWQLDSSQCLQQQMADVAGYSK